ncbi:MAG: hypothetical protein NDJ90_03445, partial [Oligoflexia bacterium]|nr:hypothetical protein [Oligoflexia bacterium]
MTGFLLVGMTFVLARDQDRINAVYGELPSELAEAANKGRESLGNKISNVFFDRISDINVFSAPLGDDGRLRLKVSRAIFSNNDIEESFTVIDRVRLPLSLPVLSVPLGNAFATFNIGLGGSLDVTNVRLVKPSNALYSAPLLRDLRKGGDLLERARAVLSSEWFATVPKELAPTPPES